MISIANIYENYIFWIFWIFLFSKLYFELSELFILKLFLLGFELFLRGLF